jgi:undecaprenyl-diphosphatase
LNVTVRGPGGEPEPTAADRGVRKPRSTVPGHASRAHAAVGSPPIGLLLVGIAGLVGFAIVTALVASGFVFPFDQPLLDAGRGLSQYMVAWKGLSDSANYPLIVIGVGLVVLLLLTRRRREAGLVIVALAAVTAGSEAVKELVARPRPPGFDNTVLGVVYSYPSGHVLEAATIYGIIAVLLWRSSLPAVVRVAIPIVFSVVVALVAIARVASGEHYPSDVLAGLFGGIGVVALFAWVSGALARRAERRAEGRAVGGMAR